MAWWTWLTWCDPIVDFGRELYLAWQIAEGRVLYRELYSTFGPLSPHVNALWFELFGVSLRSLVVANFLVLAVAVTLLYRLMVTMSDRLAATVGCVAFFLLFAFSQYLSTANYNWICPYSHEMTHGTMLALGALWCLARFTGNRQARWLAIGGALTGLTFLTKLEIFVPAAIGMLAGLIGLARIERPGWPTFTRWLAWWVASIVAVVLIAFVCLLSVLPAADALRGTLGMWMYMFDSDVTVAQKFYRVGAGLDDVPGNLREMFLLSMAVSLPLIVALSLKRAVYGVVVAVLTVAAIVALNRHGWIDWEHIARPLPLLAAICVMVLTVRCRRPGDAAVMAFAWFALLMLLKMILNARIHGYGFVLAMPATMLLIMVSVALLPRWLESHRRSGMAIRIVAIALWACLAGYHLSFNTLRMAGKDQWMGANADAFRADGRAEAFNQVLSEVSGADSMIVFPEGPMLNYLARVPSPVPYLLYIPHQVDVVGEQRMLTQMRESPPDVVVVVSRRFTEYGTRGFAAGYAQTIGDWIDQTYGKPTRSFRHEPQQGRPVQVWLFHHNNP